MYPSILLPNTGRIPDRIMCPTLASFVFFTLLVRVVRPYVNQNGSSLSSSHDLLYSRVPNKRPGTRIYFPKNASLYGPYLALYVYLKKNFFFFFFFFLHLNVLVCTYWPHNFLETQRIHPILLSTRAGTSTIYHWEGFWKVIH